MTSESTPYVAVIGGFYSLDAAMRDDAKKAARELGAELARAGFGLVVYFSDENSLEPHVVSGYVAALAPGAGGAAIRVRYPESQRGRVQFAEEKDHREVFAPRIFPGKDWEEPFYRSIVEAEGVDGVLLMAGGQSTLIAGHISLARGLPVLAIDTFPGAARVIWNELTRPRPDYPSAARNDPAQLVAWLKRTCDEQAKKRVEARRRELVYARLVSEREKSVWAAVTFVVLLALLFFGVAQPPRASVYSFLMFGGLIAAGATGALVRSVLWGSKETVVTTSLVLGGIAGFVVGLAYLIPQFVGAPGVLAVEAAAVSATDKIQFASAVLVAMSAGIGFDTVFTRLRKQAEEVAISPQR